MVISINSRSIILTLSKRRKAFVIFFASILLLTAFYVVGVPWNFESTAAVMVNFNPQDLVDASLQNTTSSSSGGGTPSPQSTGSDLAKYIDNSVADTLQSADVARRTLTKLGIDKVYPAVAAHPPLFFGTAMDAAIHRLTDKDLDVKLDKDSNTLLIGLYNRNPQVAQETLRTLLGFFQDKLAETTRNSADQFLTQQLGESQAKVDAAQSHYLDFRRQSGVSDLTDERSLLLSQRDTVEKDLNDGRAKMASDQGAIAKLNQALASLKETIPISDENDEVMKQVDSAQDRLAEAKQKYLEAQQTYKEGSPLLEDAKTNLTLAQQDYNGIKGDSESRVRTGPNTVYQTLQTQLEQAAADLSAQTALVNSYEASRAAVQARLDHLNQIENQMTSLESQVDVAKDDFKAYVQRTEEARIVDALNHARITTVSVSQEPNLPYEPKPSLVLVLALAVLAALFGAIGVAFGLEMMDQTFGSPEQIEPQVGLPVLATLNFAAAGRRRP